MKNKPDITSAAINMAERVGDFCYADALSCYRRAPVKTAHSRMVSGCRQFLLALNGKRPTKEEVDELVERVLRGAA